MPRVLITGGEGFLGAPLAALARRAGHDVTTADVLPTATRHLDATDTDAIAALVADVRPQVVVHLAAGLTDAGERDPVHTTRLNALGTAAVFTAAEAVGAERVVYATSISAVGPTRTPTGDDTRLNPGNVYGATKAFCEHLAASMSTRPNAPKYLGLRFGYVYGPGRVRGWRDVQLIVENVSAGARRIEFPDYPEPIDWTWIDDAADILLRAIERPLPRNAVANVVGDKRRMRDAIAHLQRRYPDLVADARPARTPPAAWTLVNDGLEALLGAVPTVTLEQGIDRMLGLAPAKAG